MDVDLQGSTCCKLVSAVDCTLSRFQLIALAAEEINQWLHPNGASHTQVTRQTTGRMQS